MKNVSIGIIKLNVCLQKDQLFPEKGYAPPKIIKIISDPSITRF